MDLETLRGEIPEAARDIRLNLQLVLADSALALERRWGVAVASALAAGNRRLVEAVVAEAEKQQVPAAIIDDARAAAALMAMNNVYYRFRHMVGKQSYGEKPAKLRMNRIVRPASGRSNFELFCLAVSAIGGCESCVRSHEHAVVEAGTSEDEVHDAVRIAATINAAAVALEFPPERAA